MLKRTLLLLVLAFFATSCADTWDSVKRGMTGTKAKSTDEFFVKKKDPLILPPEFERLPTPENVITETEEVSSIERKILKDTPMTEDVLSSSRSTEESILKQIRKQ